MASYAYRTKSPQVLTHAEQSALLKTTGERRGGFRDHMMFSLALATALREHELLGLNVGDVFKNGRARRRVALRVFKGSYKGIRQEVLIPDAVRARLDKFYRWKQTQRRPECTADDAPLFVSREGGRLSDRQLRTAFARWQERAGIERHYRVHDLRHTSGTNFYRLTKNIVMTKIHMRHASIESTMIYMHVCDEEMIRAAQDMPN